MQIRRRSWGDNMDMPMELKGRHTEEASPLLTDAPAEVEPHRRWPSWLPVAIGSATAAVAFTLVVTTAAAAPEPSPIPSPAILGTAELEVTRYLAEGPDGAQSTPDRFVTRATAVDARLDYERGWVVTVDTDVLLLDGAAYRSDGRHRYLVAVVDASDGPVATALPTRIDATTSPAVPAVAVGAAVADEHLITMAEGFLDAYLTGRGDIRSYVAAGSGLDALTPTPYRNVTTEAVTMIRTGDATAHLTVTGIAADGTETPLPIEVHAVVVIESDTWKVGSLVAGPTLVSGTDLAGG